MAVLLEDRETVRPFLLRDAMRNAVVLHRVYLHGEFSQVFADTLPEPKAVLALKPAQSPSEPHQFALHATDPLAALHVLKAVPKGFAIFHVADDLAFPAVKKVLDTDWWGEALLYRIDPADFRDTQRHDVGRLEPRWAEKIAKLWAPDWPAAGYVRSRIEGGPTAAIPKEGEPVAWYLTHFETEEVSMLGFLHVLDEHRRKGYAKSLSAALIKEGFARGKTPCCHVYTDNEASIRLMEGLGFKRVCLQAWGSGTVRA